LVANDAANRLTVARGDGSAKQQTVVAGQQFADPAAPDDDVTPAEQEAVAGSCRRSQVVPGRCTVEHAEGEFVPAVVHVIEKSTVAQGEVLGTQQAHISLKLNLARIVPGRQLQVNDDLVARSLGADCETSDADKLFIGAGVAESRAAGKGLTLMNYERFHFRAHRGNSQH